mmetsp:Transcript_2341/g.5368  ORF Transcript_2341/g.5368 Transcript_2341/m.5368 type:complete len:383 (+) Transcript_2341:123-1271(+)
MVYWNSLVASTYFMLAFEKNYTYSNTSEPNKTKKKSQQQIERETGSAAQSMSEPLSLCTSHCWRSSFQALRNAVGPGPFQTPLPDELGIPEPRRVPLASVAHHRHHRRTLREFQGRPDRTHQVHGGRRPDPQSLRPQHPVRHVDGLLVGDPDGPIDAGEARREIPGDPVQADALRQRVVPVLAEVPLPLLDRKGDAVFHLVVQCAPGGIDQDDPHTVVFEFLFEFVFEFVFFQVRGDSGNGPPRAAGHDKGVGTTPHSLLPELPHQLRTRLSVVNVEIRQVFELVDKDGGNPELVPGHRRRLAAEVDVVLGVGDGRGRNLVDHGAQRSQDALLLDGLVVGEDHQAGVSPGRAQGGQCDAGRSGGALDNETAGAGSTDCPQHH